MSACNRACNQRQLHSFHNMLIRKEWRIYRSSKYLDFENQIIIVINYMLFFFHFKIKRSLHGNISTLGYHFGNFKICRKLMFENSEIFKHSEIQGMWWPTGFLIRIPRKNFMNVYFRKSVIRDRNWTIIHIMFPQI